MTYRQFLEELKQRLKRLPARDREEAVRYYEEYFAEAGAEKEDEVLKELRSPAHAASNILSDYALKESARAKRTAAGGIRALWFIILGIFAAPIAVPAAVALAVVIFALVLVLAAAVIALVLGGGGLLLAGFFMLFSDTGFALILFGAALCGAGFIWLLASLITGIIRGISRLVKKL